jgi:hypothetical protein
VGYVFVVVAVFSCGGIWYGQGGPGFFVPALLVGFIRCKRAIGLGSNSDFGKIQGLVLVSTGAISVTFSF